MILHLINRTAEKVEYAFIDWKGLRGADRNRILPVLEKLKVQVKRV